MADRLEEIVTVLLSVFSSIMMIMSMLGEILTSLLVQQQTQQNLLIAQSAIKENHFMLKAKRKWSVRRNVRSCWKKPGRTEQWWTNLWQGHLPEEEWNVNLRMARGDFMKLVEELRPYVEPDLLSPNWSALSAHKKVAITLYYLKDTGSIRMTANSFGVAGCTVSNTDCEVCQAISAKLGPKYIKLPTTLGEMRELIVQFESKHGFPQAFGCIDGTHIPIQQPLENSHDSYKMKYTINVQAVCDYRGVYLDVDCRWPGSVHDAKVFSNSIINAMLREGTLPIVYKSLVPGRDKIPSLLLADPAYTLLPYCMKEFATCTTNEQVVFNNLLRSSRNQVESAFGRLKARWQILNTKINLRLENVPQVIHACFVLHNFCSLNGIQIDDDCVQRQIAYERQMQPDVTQDRIYSCTAVQGVYARDVIVEFLKEHLEH